MIEWLLIPSAAVQDSTFTPGPQQEVAPDGVIALTAIAALVTVVLLAGIGLWLIGTAFENDGFKSTARKIILASLAAAVGILIWALLL